MRAVLCLLLVLASLQAAAQGKWELKKDSEGIKIYTRSMPSSRIKTLKAEFTAQGTPARLAAALLDISTQKEWVYSTRSSVMVKKISDFEIVYYSEKDMPWPVTDRDLVVHLKIAQDTVTKIMTAHIVSADGYVAVKKDMVRVPFSKVAWTAIPVDGNHMQIIYEAQVDPGGIIPSWVVNMFATKGAFETFRKLKSRLALQR